MLKSYMEFHSIKFTELKRSRELDANAIIYNVFQAWKCPMGSSKRTVPTKFDKLSEIIIQI